MREDYGCVFFYLCWRTHVFTFDFFVVLHMSICEQDNSPIVKMNVNNKCTQPDILNELRKIVLIIWIIILCNICARLCASSQRLYQWGTWRVRPGSWSHSWFLWCLVKHCSYLCRATPVCGSSTNGKSCLTLKGICCWYLCEMWICSIFNVIVMVVLGSC